MSAPRPPASLRLAIAVCAFGYFMDVFDLNLFTVLRVPSLRDLGIPADAQAAIAGYILDAQLSGILLGAFLWSYLGDRFGRLKALYGSILIYSVATLGCSLVRDPMTYGLLRFLAGFGIAGEVGAATTLIAELMRAASRGWGVAIIAGFGIFGPVGAVLCSWWMPWRGAYVVGGALGLLLLALRARLTEPQLFEKTSAAGNDRGSLKLLLRPQQAVFLFSCIAIACIGIYCNWFLNFFSLELSRTVLAPSAVFDQKVCLLWFYIGLGTGDGLSIVVSQLWRSRLKSLGCFMACGAIVTLFYLMGGPHLKFSAAALYFIYLILGLVGGVWGLIILVAAEHVGTNIRATTATLVSNLSRAATIPMLFAFQALRHGTSITVAAALVALIVYVLAFLGLSRLRETHAVDLDYLEKKSVS